jgi:hypothetical protein
MPCALHSRKSPDLRVAEVRLACAWIFVDGTAVPVTRRDRWQWNSVRMALLCGFLDRDVSDFVVVEQVAVDVVAVHHGEAHEELGCCGVLHWLDWKLCCSCASS